MQVKWSAYVPRQRNVRIPGPFKVDIMLDLQIIMQCVLLEEWNNPKGSERGNDVRTAVLTERMPHAENVTIATIIGMTDNIPHDFHGHSSSFWWWEAADMAQTQRVRAYGRQ